MEKSVTIQRLDFDSKTAHILCIVGSDVQEMDIRVRRFSNPDEIEADAVTALTRFANRRRDNIDVAAQTLIGKKIYLEGAPVEVTAPAAPPG